MKFKVRFVSDALARQCAEAVWIKKVTPEKRINNKKEYHQPGDVEARYEKNENEEYKNKKANKKIQPKKQVENKTIQKDNDKIIKIIEPTIKDFIKKVRFETEKLVQENRIEDISTLEDDITISTQE